MTRSFASRWYGATLFDRNAETVHITLDMTELASTSFARCRKLRSITVDEKHPVYCSIDGVLFDKRERKLVCYPRQRSGRCYVVPDGTKVIGAGAFSTCENLGDIILPDTLVTIERYGISNCPIRSIVLPDSLKDLCSAAFSGCRLLEHVHIPDGLEWMGKEYPFEGCRRLRSLTIPASITAAPEWLKHWDSNGGTALYVYGICMPDIPSKVKRSAALGFVELDQAGASLPHHVKTSFERYIKNQRKRLFLYMPKNSAMRDYLISKQLIREQDMGIVLAVAIDAGDAELLERLLEYQAKVLREAVIDKMLTEELARIT